MPRPNKILAITGGVGGAKLALGLSKVLSPEQVLFAVNVGDDFSHLGLHISPDIDSLTYALAEVNNQELGWGRAGESWQFIETLGSLGGDDWFRLGDKDMALHMRIAMHVDVQMQIDMRVHHAPCTIHHAPYTIHHTPYTIHDAPCTIHHTRTMYMVPGWSRTSFGAKQNVTAFLAYRRARNSQYRTNVGASQMRVKFQCDHVSATLNGKCQFR